MAPRVTFANLNDGLQSMGLFDTMFADAGNLGITPCLCTGTNALVLTPITTAYAPTQLAYANYYQYSFIAANTSTGPITVNVAGLGIKNVYLDTTTQATTNNLIVNEFYQLAYSSTLNSGAGGFFLVGGESSSGGGISPPFVIGDLIVATSTTTLGRIADVPIGSVLISGGIGALPSWNNTITVNQNGGTVLILANSNVGVTAYAAWEASNVSPVTGTSSAFFGIGGTGATFDGTLAQNRAFVIAGASTTGIAIINEGANPILFAISSVEAGRWSGITPGKFSIGASGVVLGQLVINGNTSGQITQTVQAAAGSGTVTWGTSSGTPAVTAAAPLTITAATGNITITTGSLTKADDTNVTLTLGGTPTNALLNAVSLTLGWTGQLGLTRGGTAASLTASNGGIVYSTASALAILAGTATANQILLSGASTTPAWSTSTFPTTNAQGDIIFGSAANAWSVLAKDTNATRYLSNTGTTNNPAWAQVNLANGVTGTLPNGNLSNSSVTYGTTTVALGASSTSIAGLTSVGLTSGNTINWNSDTFIGRAGAASFQHGAADAASPVAQTIGFQNVVAGTTNTAGADATILGSLGTGTAKGGEIFFKVGLTNNSSGSTQTPTVEAMKIISTTGANANTYVKISGAGGGVLYIGQDPLSRGSNYAGFWFTGATSPTSGNYGLIAETVTGSDPWLYWNAATINAVPYGHRYQVATSDAMAIWPSRGFYIGTAAASVDPGADNLFVGNFVNSVGGFKRVSTQFDTTSTTLANVTGLSATVISGKVYRFRAVLSTSSNVGGGVKAAIAGTATATSITYEGFTISAGTTTQTRATALGTAVGAVTAVTAAEIIIEGMIVVNAGGTLTVQFAENVAVSTSSVLINSYFEVFQFT